MQGGTAIASTQTPTPEELQEARAEAEANLHAWQRATADFANYRRRINAERHTQMQQASADLVERLLPVLDDLERAGEDDHSPSPWRQGLHLIERKLRAVLAEVGVSEIEATGSFDPEMHEAITHDESDAHQEGQIIEQIRSGYRLGDRVLRPSMVRVAKAVNQEESINEVEAN